MTEHDMDRRTPPEDPRCVYAKGCPNGAFDVCRHCNPKFWRAPKASRARAAGIEVIEVTG